MTQPVSDFIKHFAIPIIVALISLGISIGVNSIAQNPDLSITLLEHHNSSGSSNIETVVYNAGNYAANKILIYYDSERTFDIISYNSSESIPQKITGTDGKLRVSIDRVAPHSFTIFTISGKENEKVLNVWATHDRGSLNLQLPYYEKDLGVTSIDLLRSNGNLLLIFALAGAILVVVTRYYLYQKSESIRRNYLGVFQIKLIRLNAKKISLSWLIILVGLLVSIPADYYSAIYAEKGYSNNQPFSINNKTSTNHFIEITNPNQRTNNFPGILIMLVAVGGAIYRSVSDIRLPGFIWLLRPTDTSNLTLDKISSSYIQAHTVFLHSKAKEWIENDMYVIISFGSIIGLVAGKELQVTDAKKDTKFESILNHKRLPRPKFDNMLCFRENFLTIGELETMGELKKKMENSIKKYAIVIDSNNAVKGVLDYASIFKMD